MKILVIEDSTTQRKLLIKIIEKIEGVQAVEAPDALEGYHLLRSTEGIKAIILDHNMPYMKGTNFIEKLRNSAEFDELPIIVSSGEDLAEVFLKVGASEVLIKPYDLERLRQAIENIRAMGD